MQKAVISVSGQKPVHYFVLKNLDDLSEYITMLNKQIEIVIARYFKEGSMEWENHQQHHNEADSLLAMAYRLCTIKGGNPLFTLPELVHQKIDAYFKCLEEGDTLIINMKGGYCLLDDNCEILSSFEHVDVKTYHIGNKTKIINFENDPKLEARTLQYFEDEGDSDPSYILNLRHFTIEDIKDVLKAFTHKGGEEVYILTTGMDVDQVEDYVVAINDSDVKRVVFEFTVDPTDRLLEIIDKNLKKETIII